MTPPGGSPVVIALGGNALLRRGEAPDIHHQLANVDAAARAIAGVARARSVVVTHGNGPQVGLLALQAEALADVEPYPFDVLGAESEGMIGYLVEQALGNHLGADRVATLLTQVVVAADDPAFAQPSKPVGQIYTQETAERLAAERGWTVAPDGASWRRVVPSPRPCDIVEMKAIEALLNAGLVVICSGGGGIPVVVSDSGRHGVEAVIDKDLSAALLAERLGAEILVLATDVDAVRANWGESDEYPLGIATTAELRALGFAAGSMGPKVEAACRFVDATGRRAVIGALEDIEALAEGRAGTLVTARTRFS